MDSTYNEIIVRERGRKRLSLRLPALRPHLKEVRASLIDELFEAYDLAATTLENLRSDPNSPVDLIEEYEVVCNELEADISRLCTKVKASNVKG